MSHLDHLSLLMTDFFKWILSMFIIYILYIFIYQIFKHLSFNISYQLYIFVYIHIKYNYVFTLDFFYIYIYILLYIYSNNFICKISSNFKKYSNNCYIIYDC